MHVVVNGKSRDVPQGATIAALIEGLALRERNVVVEHNGEAVDRANFADVTLRTGDRVEIVRAVQGG